MTRFLSPHALAGLRVVEVRGGLAAAVAGRMLAALGAEVTQVRHPQAEPSASDIALGLGKRIEVAGDLPALAAAADVVLVAGEHEYLERERLLPRPLRDVAPGALLAYATPFGLSGPRSTWRGGELVAFHASGLARLLIGPVPDLEAFPPVKAYGDQAAFAGGMTMAAAVATAVARGSRPGVIDVSIEEALASIAVHELARPEAGEPLTSRLGDATRGNATVMLLPTSDGVIAISPREPPQWDRWAEMMGNPPWALEPGIRNVRERQERYGDLYPHIAAFTATFSTAGLFREAQARHVPAFPLQPPGDLLDDQGLQQRRFFTSVAAPEGRAVRVPGSPFGLLADEEEAARHDALASEQQAFPLEGVRVLDFSWVIAGPTCTRFLAAMGAEVIKVEAPGRPDPARASILHAVLGQGKRSIALDLKAPEGREIALRLARDADVVVENFATGVMDRLGLGYAELAGINPRLVYLSLSGMGRSGPDAEMVAYGTLLQAYSGFSALNGFPHRQPTIGWAWTDPVCALAMTTAIGAALRDRAATGRGRRMDASMVETMLWTMSGAIVEQQLAGHPPERQGNADPRFCPHGVYRARGDDAWLAIAVRDDSEWHALCRVVGALSQSHSLDLDARRAGAPPVRKRRDRLPAAQPARQANTILPGKAPPAAPTAPRPAPGTLLPASATRP